MAGIYAVKIRNTSVDKIMLERSENGISAYWNLVTLGGSIISNLLTPECSLRLHLITKKRKPQQWLTKRDTSGTIDWDNRMGCRESAAVHDGNNFLRVTSRTNRAGMKIFEVGDSPNM